MKPLQILDVGCGIGRWTKELVKYFPDAEIIALDHKRRLPDIKGIKFVRGSVERLPFKNNKFDLIVASRLLPYVNMKLAIQELERVIKKDGLIVYELMQLGYYLNKLFRGNLKRIMNFINWWIYPALENKLFKKYDNIDSWTRVRYFSKYSIAELLPLKTWIHLSVYSLLLMNHNGKINKKALHNKIKKIAKEILNEET